LIDFCAEYQIDIWMQQEQGERRKIQAKRGTKSISESRIIHGAYFTAAEVCGLMRRSADRNDRKSIDFFDLQMISGSSGKAVCLVQQ